MLIKYLTHNLFIINGVTAPHPTAVKNPKAKNNKSFPSENPYLKKIQIVLIKRQQAQITYNREN